MNIDSAIAEVVLETRHSKSKDKDYECIVLKLAGDYDLEVVAFPHPIVMKVIKDLAKTK